MTPLLVIWSPSVSMRGPGWPPATDPAPPTDSPLKVWTGSEWAPAGVKVEE